jgi:hypothetical protein
MIMDRCCGWDPGPERRINQLVTPRVGTSTSAVDGFAAQAWATNAKLGKCIFCLRMHAHTLAYKVTLRLPQKSTCMYGEASASDAF